MGMFDMVMLKCPACGRELEFQSKSGSCLLERYYENDLPIYIASGITGDIVSCICGANVRFDLLNDELAKFELSITDDPAMYPGNFKEKNENE